MSWLITPQQKNKGLLDEFTGAAAAYSLRDLTYLRSGPVVRVRRSSNNAEADFSAEQVVNGALVSWVGAGNNGFVATWYDQSGNGRDVTATSQPLLVSNGSVVTRNGRPALSFASGNFFRNDLMFHGGAYSTFITAEYGSGSATYMLLPAAAPPTTSVREVVASSGGGGYAQFTLASNTVGFDVDQSFGDQFNLSILFNGTSFSAFTNGVQRTITATGPLGYLQEFFAIGRRAVQGVNPYSGKYQELILYFSDQSASRAAIEFNINAHYSIY